VRPLRDDVFQAACETCDCDIISLALGEKLNFSLRRVNVLQFLQRGGCFEIEFAGALKDATKKRFLFANTGQLLHATRGKGILLSSAAKEPMEMRSPHDLANFAAVLGLRGTLAFDSITTVPYNALQRGVMRHGCAQVAHHSQPEEPSSAGRKRPREEDRHLDTRNLAE